MCYYWEILRFLGSVSYNFSLKKKGAKIIVGQQYLDCPEQTVYHSRCSAGSLVAIVTASHIRSDWTQPVFFFFNKFIILWRLNFVKNSKSWAETGRWMSLELKRSGHGDRGIKIWRSLIVSRFPNLLWYIFAPFIKQRFREIFKLH